MKLAPATSEEVKPVIQKSDSSVVALTGADAQRALHGDDEDLAVANAIGVSRSAVSLWLEGKVGVPRPVAMLLRMLVAAQRRAF